MEKDDKGSTLIRIGVSGWKFLLVPAYPGCPGSKAVKRSLLLLLSQGITAPWLVPNYTAWWQRHVCEQLAQGCYLKAERPGVEPATVCVASQHPNHYATRQLMAITKTLLAETKWTTVAWIKCLLNVLSWWRGTVVERRSLTGELSLSCTWPAADGCPPMWVNRPLQVSQLGQLSLSSFLGR